MPLRPRVLAATVAALLTGPVLLLGPVPAQAAAKPTVTISTLKNRTAPYRESVTVQLPSVTSKGAVDLGATSFTVKHGKKTVAKNATSAKLKAGTYKVTTTATYRTFTVVTRSETVDEQQEVVAPGVAVPATCAITSITPTEDATREDLALDCTSASYQGTQAFTGQAVLDDPVWSVSVVNSPDPAVALAEAPAVGTPVGVQVTFPTGLYQTVQVTHTYEDTVYSATKKKVRTQKLVIHQGHRPGRTDPISEWNCPSWAPIKGNAQSMIYHLPGQRFYKATKPEDCFSTQAAARKAGYRKSKV